MSTNWTGYNLFHVKHEVEMSEFLETLYRLFEQGGQSLTQSQAAKMNDYYEQMVEANRAYNLTAVTAPEEAALKHFYDSAFAAGLLPEGACVADVGSGGGFPIVPLKIMREDIAAYAVESSKKKCDFIEHACKKANIGITVLNARAEELARAGERESFDVCVSRAVAALPVLLELCAPLVRPGGLFLAYKADYRRELEEGKNAMKLLSMELEQTLPLPLDEYGHFVLAFRKKASADPKYPRNYAQIAKRPL